MKITIWYTRRRRGKCDTLIHKHRNDLHIRKHQLARLNSLEDTTGSEVLNVDTPQYLSTLAELSTGVQLTINL